MKNSLLLILFSLVLYNLVLYNVNAQGLTKRVIELGNSKEDCQIVDKCECCSSELLFLNDKQFAMISPCTFDTDLTAGTYKIESNDLTLAFKQLTVTWGQKEKDGKDFIIKKAASLKPMVFKINKCEDDKTLLERPESNDLKFGLTTKGLNEEIRIKEFLKSREWKLLNK